MKNLKQKQISIFGNSIATHRKQRNSVLNSDYRDLQSFSADFLNEPDKKKISRRI